MTTQIARVLVIDSDEHRQDPSFIWLSQDLSTSIGLKVNEVVTVQGRGYRRIAQRVQIRENSSEPQPSVAVNRAAQRNLQVQQGQYITLWRLKWVACITSLLLQPVEGTCQDLGHFALMNATSPWFIQNRPVTIGERIWPSGLDDVEFEVSPLSIFEVGPNVSNVLTGHICEKTTRTFSYRLLPRNQRSLEDLAGYETQVKELRDTFIELRLGQPPSLGATLVGPRGSGKTLLARAMCDEINYKFMWNTAIVLITYEETSIGTILKSIRSDTNSDNRRSLVLIIDNVDCVLGVSSTNDLISMITKYRREKPIFQILATATDGTKIPSIIRAHAQKQINLTTPNEAMRLAMFKLNVGKLELSADFDFQSLAQCSEGLDATTILNMCSVMSDRFSRSTKHSDLAQNAEMHTMVNFLLALQTDRNGASQPLLSEEDEQSEPPSDHPSPMEISPPTRLGVAQWEPPSVQTSHSPTHPLSDYTVAFICPLGVEMSAVEAMLDEVHQDLPVSRSNNVYSFGRIGVHLVALVILPGTGTNATAVVVTQMLNDLPAIRFGLLVGIAGGTPGEADVRLGDVVVSKPLRTFGGVVQYDLGKAIQSSGEFQRTGYLNRPPDILNASVQKLSARYDRLGSKIPYYLEEMFEKWPKMKNKFSKPAVEDLLFKSDYLHDMSNRTACSTCDKVQLVIRPPRSNTEPEVHFGTIGSANVVLKDAILRDKLQQDMELLCVDMEAAGLMNTFPCLVIRGICDYADSHKNKVWQPYAAAVAAAYMKELLLIIPPQEVKKTRQAADVV